MNVLKHCLECGTEEWPAPGACQECSGKMAWDDAVMRVLTSGVRQRTQQWRALAKAWRIYAEKYIDSHQAKVFLSNAREREKCADELDSMFAAWIKEGIY